ncbi:MAG: glycosyltransferase family 4 protein [Lachnospiraceae bacterium]|nr:glycosyltransferase family 4 protein [Lachnospiraceae bacterium]
MNIGLFTDTFMPQINGVGTSVTTLAKALRAKGHNVYIFAPWAPDTKQDEDEKFVIRMPSMPFIFLKGFRVGLCYPPTAIRKIHKLKLDIVHTQTEFSVGIFGRILAKAYNIPVIHTYHTMYEDYVHYILGGKVLDKDDARTMSKICCNSARAVIAPTDKVYHALRSYGVTKPIYTIPTGINIEKFRKNHFSGEEIRNLRKKYGLRENASTILVLGRIAKEKSMDVVIKAMPSVLEIIPEARLIVVGDGPYKEILENLSKDMGIADKIIFTGAIPWTDIGIYYQLGDVFVTASVSETQGLTFAESMAAGVPIIAKKDSSIEGVIVDGKTGVVFENDNDLGCKICSLLSDKDKMKVIAENASAYVESLSAEAFANNVEALYKDILSSPDKFGISPERKIHIPKPIKFSHKKT